MGMQPGFMTIHIRRNSTLPLFRQVYAKIRDDILTGRLRPGTRLPATRRLARELGLSRNVVLEAYDQLHAEGYIESRPGSYTRVAKETFYRHYKKEEAPASPVSTGVPEPAPELAFETGLPDLSRFPRTVWGKYLKSAAETIPAPDLAYSAPQGHRGLRRVLCDYLYRVKGISVNPKQIVITSGATQALALAAGVCRRPGAEAVIEDPGGFGVIRILETAGFKLKPLPTEGRTSPLDRLPLTSATRLVYTTPSHQFPMGYILPAALRIALLEQVENRDMFIVEDDYDSEFRYEGAPIHPLKALAPEKVIYIGSFSKVLSPALRLGYAVVPDGLLEGFRSLKRYSDAQSPLMEQKALENFIRDGRFEKHVYTMKKQYRQKRDTLVSSLTERFGNGLEIFGENAGLHLVAKVPGLHPPLLAGDRLIRNGVAVDSVEKHALVRGRHGDKLIFGYGNLTRARIEEGVRRLSPFT